MISRLQFKFKNNEEQPILFSYRKSKWDPVPSCLSKAASDEQGWRSTLFLPMANVQGLRVISI